MFNIHVLLLKRVNALFSYSFKTAASLLIAISIMFFSTQTLANQQSISVDYIHGEGDVSGIKLAYQYRVDWLESWSKELGLYFESSVNFWEYGAENKHDTNFVLAMSPVIEYPITEFNNKPVYFEFGIGFSLLDDTQFAGKDVGSHYQFEDRIGIKTYFGDNNEHSIGLRYLHYSNAGLQDPNPGLDFISLSYTRLL